MNTNQTPEWRNVSKVIRPEFPVDILPEKIGELCYQYHESCGCAIDFAACVIISTVTAAVFDRFTVEITDNHKQPLTLFSFAIGDSGDNKSGPFKLFPRSLFRLLNEENRKREQDNHEIEERISELKKLMKNKNTDDNRREELVKEIRSLKQNLKPYYPYILTDATLEAVAMEAKQCGECASVFSSESTFVNAIAGTSYNQRGNTPNIDIILHGYDAEYTAVSRVGKERIVLDSPRICICIAGQKVTLDTLTRVGQQVERGFPNRCLFYIPERTYDHDATKEKPIEQNLLSKWEELIKQLFLSERGTIKPCLRLSKEALRRYQQYRNECNANAEKLRHYGEIKGWISKQPDKMIRFAGILLLMNNPKARVITEEYVKKAVRYFDEYALEMAYIAYGIKGQDLTEQQARFMQRIIDIQNKKGRCTKGALKEACKHNSQDIADFDKVFAYLAHPDNDYVRTEIVKPETGKKYELIHRNPYYNQ